MLLVLTAAVILTGCRRRDETEQARIEQLKQSGRNVEILVDARRLTDVKKLKAMLPKEMSGAKLVEAGGVKTGSIGRKFTRADAAYEGTDGEFIEASIADVGGPTGLGVHSDFAWCTNDVKVDTDTHIVLIGEIDGRRSYEEFESSSRSGKVRVLVGNRFIVEVNGSNIEFPALKALLKHMPVAELDRMAK
jgi:hypothetical protein